MVLAYAVPGVLAPLLLRERMPTGGTTQAPHGQLVPSSATPRIQQSVTANEQKYAKVRAASSMLHRHRSTWYGRSPIHMNSIPKRPRTAVRAQRLAADCYRRWRRGIVGCPPDGGGRQAELLLAGASYRAAPAM